MIKEKNQNKLLRYTELIFVNLAIILLLGRIILKDLWIADQFFIYNSLSLLMITVIAYLLLNKNSTILRFVPLSIFLFLFLNYQQLQYIFIFLHIIIIGLIIWVLLSGIPGKRITLKLYYMFIPFEIMILLFF
jgi:hypothetical protein